jgi:hypothetical protein
MMNSILTTMMIRITLLYFFICNVLVADDTYEEWENKNRAQWFAERQSWIGQARISGDSESVENLGRIIHGIGARLDLVTPETRVLYSDAKQILLTTPGHARYFAGKLSEARKPTDNRQAVDKHQILGQISLY